MRCSECVRRGLRSTVEMITDTPLQAREFYDEQGNYRHVRIEPSSTYRCSHGHVWAFLGRRYLPSRMDSLTEAPAELELSVIGPREEVA
jgi:hypothetical protein